MLGDNPSLVTRAAPADSEVSAVAGVVTRFCCALLFALMGMTARAQTFVNGPSSVTPDVATFVSKITISAPAKPCTPEEQAAADKLLKESQARQPNLVLVMGSMCPKWSVGVMAEIEGDKVTINPGFTPEQVILQLIDLYQRDTKQLSTYHQKQTAEIEKVWREYEAAANKQISNYKTLVALLQKQSAALQKENDVYRTSLQNIQKLLVEWRKENAR